eukprot:scaffold5517_cov135-Cylindrotheca_fusiformis.AAC.25
MPGFLLFINKPVDLVTVPVVSKLFTSEEKAQPGCCSCFARDTVAKYRQNYYEHKRRLLFGRPLRAARFVEADEDGYLRGRPSLRAASSAATRAVPEDCRPLIWNDTELILSSNRLAVLAVSKHASIPERMKYNFRTDAGEKGAALYPIT